MFLNKLSSIIGCLNKYNNKSKQLLNFFNIITLFIEYLVLNKLIYPFKKYISFFQNNLI